MPPRKFTRTDLNFWLDALLLLLFLQLTWVSIVVRYVFPPGTDARGWRLWGGDYDRWCGLQFALLVVFAAALLLHVMLHWSWVCGVVASRLGANKNALRDDGSQTLWGVGLIIVLANLVGLAVAAAAFSIVAPAN
jgi:hypothetical protein